QIIENGDRYRLRKLSLLKPICVELADYKSVDWLVKAMTQIKRDQNDAVSRQLLDDCVWKIMKDLLAKRDFENALSLRAELSVKPESYYRARTYVDPARACQELRQESDDDLRIRSYLCILCDLIKKPNPFFVTNVYAPM